MRVSIESSRPSRSWIRDGGSIFAYLDLAVLYGIFFLFLFLFLFYRDLDHNCRHI